MNINNCPFCESEDTPINDWEGSHHTTHWVECSKCNGTGPEGSNQEEAIEAWNKPGDRIKELEDALAVCRQTVAEVRHAQRDGPEWYTKGKMGLYMQVSLWLDRAGEAVKVIGFQPMETGSESAYGFCPECREPGFSRERRMNGDDQCRRGHVYPSAKALLTPIKN